MKFVGMGDNVVDRYVNKNIMFPGGNAVNFALYTKQCGADSAYLGVFADDTEGRLIRGALIESGVDVSACPVLSEIGTECCDVVLVEGDRTFVGSSIAGRKEHRPLTLGDRELSYLRNFEVIHCGCYAYMENEMPKIKDFSCIRTFDFSSEPEYRTDEYFAKICPSVDMALFSGEDMDESEMQALSDRVRAFGTSYVLITKGTKGQILFGGQNEYKGRVKQICPVDTMGAGDAFFSAFVTELVRRGWRRELALKKEMIEQAFSYAADFSSANCLVEGSFGFAKAYSAETEKGSKQNG